MLLRREASGTTCTRGSNSTKSSNRSTSSISRRVKSSTVRYLTSKHVSDSGSDSEDDSGSEDEDESESEDSVDETLDCKVTISQSGEVRGFSISTSRGFYIIMKQLEESYGSTPRLSYYDDEGDKISILASSDFEYAVRAHKNSTSLERKSKKMGANKLTFIAEFGCGQVNGGTIRSGNTSRLKTPRTPSPLVSSLSSSSVSPHISRSFSCADLPYSSASANEVKEPNLVMWQRGELLGSGAFGQVYSGIDMGTGLRIAVKEVMLGTGKKQEQQAIALLREIKILSELDHPNIIKYLGTEYSEHTMRIFLELATEGSLKDAISAFGALAEPIIRRYTLDIVSGLAFLHSKRFIHRDIKPTNLLISNGVIKVADFGCSSSSFDPIAGYSTSEMGHVTVTGTTVYMAPEVMGVEDESSNDNSSSSDSKDSDSSKTKLKRKSFSQVMYKEEYDHGTGIGVGAVAGADADHRTVSTGHSPIPPVSALTPLVRKDSLLDEAAVELKKENNNDPEASTTCVVRKKVNVVSSRQVADTDTYKRHGYGRKADIWSLGVTLSEISTGKSPYRTAAAAIYSVCVSKKYPTFAENMSADAHSFLSRCLVADPRLRAGCEELLNHPFLEPQTVAQLRLQSGTHTCSTISFKPLEPICRGLKPVREEVNSREVERVDPCTTAIDPLSREKECRQSSMGGATVTWPTPASALSEHLTGTTLNHREHRDTGRLIKKKDTLAKTIPSIKSLSARRPLREDKKHY